MDHKVIKEMMPAVRSAEERVQQLEAEVRRLEEENERLRNQLVRAATGGVRGR